MKSSESSSFRSSASSSSSSLNASAVESFCFSPCKEEHRYCMGGIAGVELPGSSFDLEIKRAFSPDNNIKWRKKQTLGELMKFQTSSSEESEEEQFLLCKSRVPHQRPPQSPGKPPKPPLVKALCGNKRNFTSPVPLPRGPTPIPIPIPLRSESTTRSRCNTPSPLRNSSSCCGRKNNVVSHVVNCTVVRSKSLGNIPLQAGHISGPDHEFLTKSRSVGASQHNPRTELPPSRSLSSNGSGQRYPSTNPSSLPARSNSGRRSSFTYNPSTSGRRSSSVTYTKTSSVNSSSGDSLLSVIDRYQQHKNNEAQHKRRNSFLPYKSALLSFFFPLPSFWSQQPAVQHQSVRSVLL